MAEPSVLLRAFLQQASAKGSKSTILKPLGWMMTLCISATITSAQLKLPSIFSYFFAGFSCATMVLYLVAYIYCLFNDRDALRSETYSIQKMAIEKGFIGDDTTGVIENKSEKCGQLLEHSQLDDGEDDK